MDKQKRTSKANDASYLKNWKRSNKEKVKTYQRKYRASHASSACKQSLHAEV